MDEGDRGVLGNLPHSRPGRRSEKRSAPGQARPRPRVTRKSEAAAKRATRVSEPAPPEPESTGGPQDALGAAVRTAGRVVSAGVQVSTGLAREVLRRLPGPF
jgi:hypothetical protein